MEFDEVILPPGYTQRRRAPVTTYTPGQGDPSMEGGYETSSGAPMTTLERTRAGQDPYVTVAVNPRDPRRGTRGVFQTASGETQPAAATDTGPGVKNADVASSDPRMARSTPGDIAGGQYIAFDEVILPDQKQAAPTQTIAERNKQPIADEDMGPISKEIARYGEELTPDQRAAARTVQVPTQVPEGAPGYEQEKAAAYEATHPKQFAPPSLDERARQLLAPNQQVPFDMAGQRPIEGPRPDQAPNAVMDALRAPSPAWMQPAEERVRSTVQAARDIPWWEEGKGGIKHFAKSMTGQDISLDPSDILPPGKTQQIAAGAVKGLDEFGKELTTTDNMALAMAMPAGAAGKAVQMYFAYQVANTLPDQWEEFKNAQTLEEKTRIAAKMVATAGTAGLAGAHGTSIRLKDFGVPESPVKFPGRTYEDILKQAREQPPSGFEQAVQTDKDDTAAWGRQFQLQPTIQERRFTMPEDRRFTLQPPRPEAPPVVSKPTETLAETITRIRDPEQTRPSPETGQRFPPGEQPGGVPIPSETARVVPETLAERIKAEGEPRTLAERIQQQTEGGQRASTEPTAAEMGVRGEGAGVGEGAPLRQPGIAAKIREQQEAVRGQRRPGKAFRPEVGAERPTEIPRAREQPQPGTRTVPEPAAPRVEIKKAAVDVARAERGLEPIFSVAQRDFGQAWDKADQERAQEPGIGSRLVDLHKDTPKASDDVTKAHLVRELGIRQGQFDAAQKAVNESVGTPENAAAMQRLSEARERYNDVHKATRNTGTGTSAGLNAMKMFTDQQLTRPAIESRLRAAQGGKPLSEKQLKQIQKMAAQHEAARVDLEAKEAAAAQAQATAAPAQAQGLTPAKYKQLTRKAKAGHELTEPERQQVLAYEQGKGLKLRKTKGVGGAIGETGLAGRIREQWKKTEGPGAALGMGNRQEFLETDRGRYQIHALAGEHRGKFALNLVKPDGAAEHIGIFRNITEAKRAAKPAAAEPIAIDPRFRVVGSRGRGEAKATSDYDLVTKLSPAEYKTWVNTPEGEYPRLPQNIKDVANAGHDVFIETDKGQAWKVEPHPVDEGQIVVERVSRIEKNLLAGKAKPAAAEPAIKAAAVRMSDGKVFTGPTHGLAMEEAVKAGYPEKAPVKPGFVDRKNAFLDNYEAEQRAAQVGQIQHASGEGLEAEDFNRTARAPLAERLKAKPAAAEPTLAGRIKGLAAEKGEVGAVGSVTGKVPATAKAEKAMRTRLGRMTEAGEKQLKEAAEAKAKGVPYTFTKPTKTQYQYSAEVERARGELAAIQNQIERQIRKQELKSQPFLKRALRTTAKAVGRTPLLMGAAIYPKLGAAAFTQLAYQPIETAAMHGTKYLLPKRIREQASLARFSPAAELAALKGAGHGAKQFVKRLKGEKAPEEELYGKPDLDPHTWLDFPGATHAAVKAAPMEAGRARATVLLERHAREQGLNPNDPRVRNDIGTVANQEAKRQAFMEDNIVSEWWNSGITQLENSKKYPIAGPLGAFAMRMLQPIVKIPTNIGIRFGSLIPPIGPVAATGKLVQVMRRADKSVTPQEANFIARNYARGAIGLGLFATGYFMRANGQIGGFYKKKSEQEPGDVEPMGMRIGGVDIDPLLLHAPAFITMNAGASFYDARHHTNAKGEHDQSGPLRVLHGLSEEIPFMKGAGVIDELLGDNYAGEKARMSFVTRPIPQGVKEAARWTDPVKEPYYRAPRNAKEFVMKDIPWLREQVRVKGPGLERVP